MSLAQRSVRSSSYTITASAITTVIQLVRSILLARILSPDDFGIYAFAFSFVIFTKAVPLFGLGGALIHHCAESEGEPAYQTHFTLTAIFTLIWAVIVAIVGYFYSTPENRWIIWIILATQVIDNLVQTGANILAKQVKFRRVAVIQTLSTLLSTTTALLLAWQGFGVFSLVSTDIIEAIVPLAGYYLIKPVWKVRIKLYKEIVPYFLQFGQRAFLTGLLQDILDNLDNLWTHRILGKSALGFYSRAYTFATYPRKVLATPLASVSVATYAELKDERKLLSQAFFRVNAFLIRLGFLFAGLLTLLAPEFIQLVIGEKWAPMLTAFRLMLIFTLLDPLKNTIGGLFIAVGKPEVTVRIRLIQFIVMVVCLATLSKSFGIAGVALSVDVMIVAGIIMLLTKSRQYVDFSIRQLFLIPFLALSLGIFVSWLLINFTSESYSPWASGSIKTVSFITLYASVILFFERKQIPLILRMVKLIK